MHSLPSKPFKFLLFASRPYWGWAFAAFVAVSFAGLSATLVPYFFGRLIDAATTGVDMETVRLWLIGTIGLLGLRFLFWRTSGFLGIEWVTKLNGYAYKKLFEHLSNHSHSYFGNRFAGAVTNKISHASDGSEKLADNLLWNYYVTLLTLIFSGVLIFNAHLYVGYIYIFLISALVVMNYFMVRYRQPFVVQYAKENTVLRGQAVGVATNMDAVRNFSQRSFETALLGGQVDIRKKADFRQWRLGEISLVLNNVVILASVGGIMWILFYFYSLGAVTLGTFVMVITLLLSILSALNHIGGMMNGFIRVYGEMEEGLSEILIPHDIVDMKDAKKLNVTSGSISFENMAFAYNEENVFTDFNLYVEPGEKVGIVGASGAGKTTLINLLLRQHDITGGSVKIDGQDILRVTQDSLREAIAVVPQEPLLFHRSIRENIAYGDQKATQKQIEEAAKMAEAHTFILETPEKYDTQVGERGVKLSGGQKQRIAVARAMLKSAPILVLDEATSALDSESEALIQKALHDLMKGKTVLAIAHRLPTLREMDRIIVMENGSIVQSGTHQELVAEEGSLYARLWAHQAEGFLKEGG